jgi:hypothetical protein
MRNAERAHRLPLAAAAVLGLSLAVSGCGLDDVETPQLIGPSETGISVQLTALPDTINADGVSGSTIQLVLRDSAGKAVTGRAVLFEFDGDGGQRDRMAERDQLGGPLGAHDPGDAGGGQRVALG